MSPRTARRTLQRHPVERRHLTAATGAKGARDAVGIPGTRSGTGSSGMCRGRSAGGAGGRRLAGRPDIGSMASAGSRRAAGSSKLSLRPALDSSTASLWYAPGEFRQAPHTMSKTGIWRQFSRIRPLRVSGSSLPVVPARLPEATSRGPWTGAAWGCRQTCIGWRIPIRCSCPEACRPDRIGARTWLLVLWAGSCPQCPPAGPRRWSARQVRLWLTPGRISSRQVRHCPDPDASPRSLRVRCAPPRVMPGA